MGWEGSACDGVCVCTGTACSILMLLIASTDCILWSSLLLLMVIVGPWIVCGAHDAGALTRTHDACRAACMPETRCVLAQDAGVGGTDACVGSGQD